MDAQWQYQVRVYLTDAMAEAARSGCGNPAMRPLQDVLDKHHAAMKSQFDAFSDYLAEAEREGPENFPLYKWTKATLDDPVKRGKHFKAFALHISGSEVYPQEAADALEAALQPLVGDGITQVSKHDTNPANNLRIPPEHQ